MHILTVSAKGHIVLPLSIRKRLGLQAGSTLHLEETADGVQLSAPLAVQFSDVSRYAGMVQLTKTGVSRSLDDFDPATICHASD